MKRLFSLIILLISIPIYAGEPEIHGGGFGSSIVEQSDCSTITSGFCVDTDDGLLYYWDGDSVELGSGSSSVGSTSVTSDASPYAITYNNLYDIYTTYITPHQASVTVTPSESGVTGDKYWFIYNVPTSTDVLVIADSSGVVEVDGSSVTLQPGQWIRLKYVTNIWVQVSEPINYSSFQLPYSDDPDIDATGKASLDTDGWLRVYQNSLQKAIWLDGNVIQAVVYKPNSMDDAQRDAYGAIFSNRSGMNFVILGWSATSSSDDTSLNIEEVDEDGQNNTTVDAVEIATNGTGVYYASDTTITAATIENGHKLYLDFDDTDDPAQVSITIWGYYNADVN